MGFDVRAPASASASSSCPTSCRAATMTPPAARSRKIPKPSIGLAEARAILSSELERKANEATEQVTWGPDAIKAVIGRGGSTIQSIHDATAVRIDADVDAGTLIIVGPREQVTSALTLAHNAAFGEAQDVLELGSRNAVNVVYGPNFQTIRDMQDATGCKLEITRGTTTLKLSGSPEAVVEAANQVRELLEANRGFDMTIEASKVGAVYGKGGETLRSIQDRTGFNIDVARRPTRPYEDMSSNSRCGFQQPQSTGSHPMHCTSTGWSARARARSNARTESST